MTLRRASVILPCHGWDDFPTHLGSQASAELLAAWTALWHPTILAATEQLPGWHQAEEPPDPSSLERELVLVPPPSRERMPSDWCDRFAATAPLNPLPVLTTASRPATVAAILAHVSRDTTPAISVDPTIAADFHALGYAYLHVDLLTRAMRYSSVLNTEHFSAATIAAARAAHTGNTTAMQEELARAFDLLNDARHHVYSVDYYVVDLTLVADSVLGEPLRAKLTSGVPTNVLIAGEQIEQLATAHPATLAALRSAVAADTASIIGGKFVHRSTSYEGPEALVAEISRGQQTALQYIGREYEIFGQFDSTFTPLLPQVLRSFGFKGALHCAFDGGTLPRADQRKTNWGTDSESSVEALCVTPLSAADPDTWLSLPKKVGDSIAHDHVATVVLAGYPGAECEYLDDLRRAARFGTVLGKLITLDEYFQITRQSDDWVRFSPREYANRSQLSWSADALSNQVAANQREATAVHRQIAAGLAAATGLKPCETPTTPTDSHVVINPWSFETNYIFGLDPLTTTATSPASTSPATAPAKPALLPDVLACGYRALLPSVVVSPVALAEDLVLRNERLEVAISQKTGGIQSLRMHRDRSTRVSQRLVFHHETSKSVIESQMVAGRVRISRNDELVGEITSSGRLLDPKGKLLANFTQRVRVVRGILPIIIEVELEPQQMPSGNPWKSYFASRIAWVDEALAIRRGTNWAGRETEREQIESPEWVEIDDVIGRVHLLRDGPAVPSPRRPQLARHPALHRRRIGPPLPLRPRPRYEKPRASRSSPVGLRPTVHRRNAGRPIGPPRLVSPRRRQERAHHARRTSLFKPPATTDDPESPTAPGSAGGSTEPPTASTTPIGIRARLYETDGRDTRTTLTAFRPFTSARLTDFRGNPIEVLSLSNGAAEIDLPPYRYLQVEAEW
ncbi:MAG: hypothetical protein U0805_07585 [Pirellulales bacterium]